MCEKSWTLPSDTKLPTSPSCSIAATIHYLSIKYGVPRTPEDQVTLDAAVRQQRLEVLVGDAGYESERFHRYCREQLGIESIIPTTERGRPRKDGKPRPVNGYYRQKMKNDFPRKTYGQRWQIETVFSMLKRNMGASLRARSHHSQTREIRARLLAHNLAILL
jgi:hypothetical protein